MTDKDPTLGRSTAADAELADAMDSIQSIGEDWRSSERATESDQDADEKGITDA